MSMYSESIMPEIDEMFARLLNDIVSIAENSLSREDAANGIVQKVGRETARRSNAMFTDMYDALSSKFLENRDTALIKKFRRADLFEEISEKYSFAPLEEGLDYKNANRILISIGISAGITAGGAGVILGIGEALKYALRNDNDLVIPVPVIIAAAAAGGLIALLSTRGKVNKYVFKQSAKEYLTTVKKEYISWLDEVENYFKRRAEEVCR